jgi:hypothetical protein
MKGVENVFTVEEPVGSVLKMAKDLDTSFSFKERQSAILAVALEQTKLAIQILERNPDAVVIWDRCLIDVFIFTYMNELTPQELVEEFYSFIRKNKVSDLFFSEKGVYILPPPSDVLESCFKVKARKETISQVDFYEAEKKFRSYYAAIAEEIFVDYKYVKHPAVDSFAHYDILNYYCEI